MTEVLLGDVPALGAKRRGGNQWAVRHGDAVLSWGELADRVLRRTHALDGAGVRQGDRVVLAMPNCNAFFELLYAVWKLGATPTVVSAKLPLAELRAILELAEPSCVIAADPDLGAAVSALPADFGRDHHDTTPFETRLAPNWKAMTSGGSTGRPKLIVDHLPSKLPADMPTSLRIPRDGVILNAGPLYHNFPFAMSNMALFFGSSIVGMEKFDAAEFLRLVEEYRVQWTALVPTMMGRVAKLPDEVRAAHDLSSLETVWHTAAPIPPSLKEFWIDWLGPERIWEIYGGTEGFATTQLSGSEWLDHRGSVGQPVGCEMLVRGEDGSALRPGEIGEIYMRRLGATGDEASYHYVGADSRRLPDGFESFGDHGWVDEDGYLYIADRRTDLILSGGRNIYPAEVESALLAHQGVAEAIVIGLPDTDLGSRAHAIVRLEQGDSIDEDELLAFLREKLIAYKLPRTIEFTSDALRDEAGKARRSKLREERIAAMESAASD